MASPTVPATNPQTIVVHSSTGGVGKTLLALGLGGLYASKGLNTILVDLAQYGSVGPWLQLPRNAGTGVTGLLTGLKQGGMTDLRVRSALVPVPMAGENLHIVQSSGPAKMDQITAADTELLLNQLALGAQVVIVDTASDLSDRVIGALMAATKVVLVVTPQVVCGWHTLELMEILRSAYVKRDKFGVVYNRVMPGRRYGIDEYTQTLGLPVWAEIPETDELRMAIDLGRPPQLRSRDAGGAAIRRLVNTLIPVFSPKELGRPWRSSK